MNASNMSAQPECGYNAVLFFQLFVPRPLALRYASGRANGI